MAKVAHESLTDPLARTREICLALPETNERLSHGSPSFFIKDKTTFASFHDDHHNSGRIDIWCPAPAFRHVAPKTVLKLLD